MDSPALLLSRFMRERIGSSVEPAASSSRPADIVPPLSPEILQREIDGLPAGQRLPSAWS